MVKIAICDDESKDLVRIKQLIREPSAEVFTFCSGKEFLKEAEKFDIVILDIEMPGIDGMKIASELKKRNRACILLFVTSFGYYSTKGYEFRAFRYVLKTEPDCFIQRNIQDAIDEYYDRNFFLQIAHKRDIAKIRVCDILYIESIKHTVIVYTLEGNFFWSNKLEAVKMTLQDYHFVQCHKSFLVNLKYIRSIEKGSWVHLNNKKSVPIGRKYNADIIQKYLEYSDRRN